jgi:hypothetical protein
MVDSHVECVVHNGWVAATEEMTIARDVTGARSDGTSVRWVEQRKSTVRHLGISLCVWLVLRACTHGVARSPLASNRQTLYISLPFLE